VSPSVLSTITTTVGPPLPPPAAPPPSPPPSPSPPPLPPPRPPPPLLTPPPQPPPPSLSPPSLSPPSPAVGGAGAGGGGGGGGGGGMGAAAGGGVVVVLLLVGYCAYRSRRARKRDAAKSPPDEDVPQPKRASSATGWRAARAVSPADEDVPQPKRASSATGWRAAAAEAPAAQAAPPASAGAGGSAIESSISPVLSEQNPRRLSVRLPGSRPRVPSRDWQSSWLTDPTEVLAVVRIQARWRGRQARREVRKKFLKRQQTQRMELAESTSNKSLLKDRPGHSRRVKKAASSATTDLPSPSPLPPKKSLWQVLLSGRRSPFSSARSPPPDPTKQIHDVVTRLSAVREQQGGAAGVGVGASDAAPAAASAAGPASAPAVTSKMRALAVPSDLRVQSESAAPRSPDSDVSISLPPSAPSSGPPSANSPNGSRLSRFVDDFHHSRQSRASGQGAQSSPRGERLSALTRPARMSSNQQDGDDAPPRDNCLQS